MLRKYWSWLVGGIVLGWVSPRLSRLLLGQEILGVSANFIGGVAAFAFVVIFGIFAMEIE